MSGPTPTPTGRRAAERRRAALDVGAVLATVLLVLAATTAYLTGQTGESGGPIPRATTEPVEEVTGVCLPGPGRRAVLRTYAAPLAGAAEGGSLGQAAVDGSGETELEPARGETLTLDPPAEGQGLVVTARDAAAVGRATSRTDRDEGVLAHQECASPRANWWFTGAGVAPAHGSELVLANVDSGPAVVDVTVYGPDGPVETVDTRGISVASGATQVVDLADVAPETDEVAVSVATSRGRVVAAVADTVALDDRAASGREWLPAQAEASRRVRLAPLPARADRRTLVVANPSDREALVQVEVSGGAGSFAPTEGAELRVPPGAVASADLTDAVGREASAVTLRSTARVAATVRSEGNGDVSYAAASPVLTGPAAATVPDGAGRVALHLSAGPEGAQASVVSYASDGAEVRAETLDVPAGATLPWAPGRAAAYVVVTTQRGWVYGGLVTGGADGLSQAPLRSLPLELRRPAVTPGQR